MSLSISEAELLGMPEELLLKLRSYLQSVRGVGNPPGGKVGLAVAAHKPDPPVAQGGPGPWSFDAHRLTISETPPGQSPAGLRIEQALGDGSGPAYVAVQWRLNGQLRKIVDLALEYGFNKLWQTNHPQEAYLEGGSKFDTGVKYISFSRAHGDRWDFAVDVGNSKPPDVRTVVFEKQHRKTIEPVLGKALEPDEPARPGRWKWERGGGVNILVDPSDVQKILGEIGSYG